MYALFSSYHATIPVAILDYFIMQSRAQVHDSESTSPCKDETFHIIFIFQTLIFLDCTYSKMLTMPKILYLSPAYVHLTCRSTRIIFYSKFHKFPHTHYTQNFLQDEQ